MEPTPGQTIASAKESVDQALKALLSTIDDEISEREVSSLKKSVINDFVYLYDDVSSLGRFLAQHLARGMSFASFQDFPTLITKASIKDIKAEGRQFLQNAFPFQVTVLPQEPSPNRAPSVPVTPQ